MRTQRLNRFKNLKIGVHFAIDPAQPHCRYLIWPGALPDQTIPIHRCLGIQISAGYIGNSPFWLERCDAEWCLAEHPEMATREFLSAARNAMQFLHENDRYHGAININHLGVRRDGWPIWLGVGLKKGSIKSDQAAWEKMCMELIGEPLIATENPIILGLPPEISLDIEDEVLFEITIEANRDIRDAPDYNNTPSSSFPEVTQSHFEPSEWTNSIPHADALSSPSSGAMRELLSWMLQNESELIADESASLEVADLLLPLDPYPSQSEVFQQPSLIWDDVEKEHTEIFSDYQTGTDTNILQGFDAVAKKKTKQSIKLISAAVLLIAGCFFSFYYF